MKKQYFRLFLIFFSIQTLFSQETFEEASIGAIANLAYTTMALTAHSVGSTADAHSMLIYNDDMATEYLSTYIITSEESIIVLKNLIKQDIFIVKISNI